MYKLTDDPNLINYVENGTYFTTHKKGSAGWLDYENWLASGNIVKSYRTPERQVIVDSIQHSMLVEQVMQKAVAMKAEAEIKGEIGALATAKAWYQSEVDKINLKFGG